eukprot:gene6039-7707_t
MSELSNQANESATGAQATGKSQSSGAPENEEEIDGGEDEEDFLNDLPRPVVARLLVLRDLQNHQTISQLITPEDIPALEALTDIRCEYNDDMTGFALIFTFAENAFFNNKELKKTYTVSPDLLDEKAPSLTEVESTPIDWKPKQNLCVLEIRKKQRAKAGKKSGQVRYVTTTQSKPSFFHFFSQPRLGDDEDDEEDEEEDPEKGGKSDLRLSLDDDYEISHCIRTSIIPE